MRLCVLLLLTLSAAAQEGGWWMREPIRWLQTNLRETDASLDPERLITQVADLRANVLHFSMGGIVAHYSTAVPFHPASRYLPTGRDLVGDVIRLAHARGIRVVGRFDLSKAGKDAYDAHPEWFFRKADGSPVIYNGLYSTCINGPYYREQGMRILSEALERYDVDGLFFNMFGNQSRDYSGNFVGHCHCDACKTKFREMFGRELPAEPDEQYREFLFRGSREVAAMIGDLIHAKRPKAGYFNYIQEYTDGIMSESNTAVNRAPWLYSASDNVNRARNSEPGKMAINLNMQFVDFPWRFATVPPAEIRLRAWQNLAHGGALTLAINGTIENQQDRQALEAARPVFRWAAENEGYFAGQRSAARVLLLGGSARSGRTFNQAAYRGMFRFLTEEHIPFAVADNTDCLGKREFDLVIATDWAPAELAPYVALGGRLMIVGPRQPEIETPVVVGRYKDVDGYPRVRNHTLFPSLRETELVMLDGEYAVVEGDGSKSLSLVPPSLYGPPEKIHVDIRDTDTAGWIEFAGGRTVWIPWDLAALYAKHGLPAHAGILRDTIDRLVPQRQVRTNAHPLIEMSLMQQGDRRLLHLVNTNGHSQGGYFPPVPVRDIRVTVAGSVKSARAVRGGSSLPVKAGSFVVPVVNDYELIVIE